MKNGFRFSSMIMGGLVTAVALVGLAVPAAHATNNSATCEYPGLCLYYNANTTSARDLVSGEGKVVYTSAYTFKTWSPNGVVYYAAGNGQQVKNNAAWVSNYSTCPFLVVYYSDFRAGGPYQLIPAYGNSGWSVKLNSTMQNNNAGQYESCQP